MGPRDGRLFPRGWQRSRVQFLWLTLNRVHRKASGMGLWCGLRKFNGLDETSRRNAFEFRRSIHSSSLCRGLDGKRGTAESPCKTRRFLRTCARGNRARVEIKYHFLNVTRDAAINAFSTLRRRGHQEIERVNQLIIEPKSEMSEQQLQALVLAQQRALEDLRQEYEKVRQSHAPLFKYDRGEIDLTLHGCFPRFGSMRLASWIDSLRSPMLAVTDSGLLRASCGAFEICIVEQCAFFRYRDEFEIQFAIQDLRRIITNLSDQIKLAIADFHLMSEERREIRLNYVTEFHRLVCEQAEDRNY